MCGRYQMSDDQDIEEINKILEELNKKYYGSVKAKTGDICPTDSAAVLSMTENKASLSVMKWGFAKWDGKGVIINARSESAAEKRMFSNALSFGRCVLPSTGFYEWDADKKKFLINLQNDSMLYMAGLYENDRFVILTTEASGEMKKIHDRVPVMLQKTELMDWLQDERFMKLAFRRKNLALRFDML